MIRNEDAGEKTSKAGYEKQKRDCERKAAARLLEKHGAYYKTLKATVPGAGLYANHAACKAVPGQGLGFIFTCKDESHPRIAGQAGRGIMETPGTVVWAGRNHLEYNFGHGDNHAGEGYCVLNLPAFPVHGLMMPCDEDFIKTRGYFGRRDEFYSALRTFFRAFEFQTWEDLLLSVIAQTRGG